MKVALYLNGRPVELECRADEMLLDVLRREAGLRSVRETCRIGVCGACTVLVDDEPISGCLMLTAQAAGRRVTTVDGLLAVAVLLGLSLNAAAGWWWADPLAGYVLVGYAVREAREIFTR
jgi:aerobic-type carbon monoxide dehydrogenase small subunit (CoxS/CutS family)